MKKGHDTCRGLFRVRNVSGARTTAASQTGLGFVGNGGDCQWLRCSRVPRPSRRHADQQIGERKANAFGLTLAIDLPRAKSHWTRDRMDGQSHE